MTLSLDPQSGRPILGGDQRRSDGLITAAALPSGWETRPGSHTYVVNDGTKAIGSVDVSPAAFTSGPSEAAIYGDLFSPVGARWLHAQFEFETPSNGNARCYVSLGDWNVATNATSALRVSYGKVGRTITDPVMQIAGKGFRRCAGGTRQYNRVSRRHVELVVDCAIGDVWTFEDGAVRDVWPAAVNPTTAFVNDVRTRFAVEVFSSNPATATCRLFRMGMAVHY